MVEQVDEELGLYRAQAVFSRLLAQQDPEGLADRSSAATILASTSPCWEDGSKTESNVPKNLLLWRTAGPQGNVQHHGLEPRLVHLLYLSSE